MTDFMLVGLCVGLTVLVMGVGMILVSVFSTRTVYIKRTK